MYLDKIGPTADGGGGGGGGGYYQAHRAGIARY